MKIMDNIYLVGSGQVGLSHPFDCHIYLIDGENELALIDAGAGEDVDKVLSNIKKEGFNPEKVGKIILTHHHADHSGGCKRIKDITSCKVFIQKEGADLVEEGDEDKMGLVVAKRSGLYSPSYTFSPFKVDYRMEDKDEILIGKLKLKVIHTPGHSRDSACLYLDAGSSKVLFSGDVVFFEDCIPSLQFSFTRTWCLCYQWRRRAHKKGEPCSKESLSPSKFSIRSPFPESDRVNKRNRKKDRRTSCQIKR